MKRYLDESDAGRRIMQRCNELACYSVAGEGVTRLYLSPEHKQAADALCLWMRQAGMDVRLDEVGNVIGRYHASTGGGPYLIIGSHQDSVIHGGKYDGPLGIVTALDCVAILHSRQQRFPFGIEVVAFGDEEGTRFKTTLAGSRAVVGTFGNDLLDARDSSGMSLKEAMIAYGLNPDEVANAAHPRADVLGYVEVHIEQGPVLEAEDLPICGVSAISGQSRSIIKLISAPNHAGTVPMKLRHDPLLAACEIALAVERVAHSHEHTVGTVGAINAEPGVMNVIPGSVTMFLDVRSPSDEVRGHAYSGIEEAAREIAGKRGVDVEINPVLNLKSCPCAPWIVEQMESAIAKCGVRPVRLPSGAGHDGMAMSNLTAIGMLFVRCRKGISHSPDESVMVEDVLVAARALLCFLENFEPRG